MRSLLVVALIACCSGAVAGQEGQLPKSQKPDKSAATLVVYPVPHLGKKEVDPILPWLRAFAGERGAVEYKAKSGLLLLKADRVGHKRATDVLAWVATYTPLQLEVSISELHGDAARLKSLTESMSPILADREAVTKLLRAAKKQGGLQLKSFPSQKLLGRAPVVLREKVGAAKKGERGSLVVGATCFRNEKFLARTWSPATPCTEMQCGQTLVVDDVGNGRLILVRFDKVIAERRPAQIVPVAPVLLPPGKRRPKPRKAPGVKKDTATVRSPDRGLCRRVELPS